MMSWPFLFCQKPIVFAPVFIEPQTVTVHESDWPVWVMFAVFV